MASALGTCLNIWRRADRAERWLMAGIAALGAGMLATMAIAAGERNDMDIYLAAAHDMLAGENMYLKTYNTWYNYFYSPLFALLISPLLLVGPGLAKGSWALLGLAAMARSVVLLLRLGGIDGWPLRHRLAAVLLTLLFLFQAIRDNINAMQVTLLLVWLCVEGLVLIRSGRWPWGAALIALGIDMKMIPLVLLPYLLWRRQWKPVVALAAWVLVLQAAPALALGWDRLNDLQATRSALIDPNDPRHIIDEEEPSFIALGSLLSAYLSSKGGNDHSLHLPRNFTELTVEQLGLLLLLGRLLFAGAALLFLRWPPFVDATSPGHRLREVGYLLLVCVLIFPHQRNYSMYLALPAVLWLAHFTLVQGMAGHRRWLLGCLAAYLITNADLLLGEYSGVYMHYKLLSFLVIALALMLYWAAPARLPAHHPASHGA